jgi:hypothetical protein
MSDVLSSWMKILLGVIVLVVIVAGVSLLFKNNIIDFFKNLGGSTGIFLPLI